MARLLRPAQDLVFQNLFGRNSNKKITGYFLSLVLEKEIKHITLDRNKRLLGGDIKTKLPRLDLRAEYNDGENSIIEMQATEYERMEERMLFYWALAYKERLPKGEDYKELKPVVSILIANYEIKQFEKINKYHTVWNLRESEYLDYILTKDMELHILEIPKIKKLGIDISKDELALWLSFINNPRDEEVKKMVKKGSALDQAMKELKNLSGDPGFREIVQARAKEIMDENSFRSAAKRQGRQEGFEQGIEEGREEGKKQGLEEGKKQGLEEGKKQGLKEGKKQGLEEGKKQGLKEGKKQGMKEAKITIAQNMLQNGEKIEKIIDITGLSKEEIEKLKTV